MLLAVAPAVAAAQTIGIAVGDSARVELTPGVRLTVPLLVDIRSAGGVSIAALQGRLTWSSSRLTLDSIRAISGWTLTANQDSVAFGRINFSTFSTSVLATSGPAAMAYFTATSSAGGTRIAFTPIAVGDEAGTNLLPLLQTRGQDICVGTFGLWGDVTDDAQVNVIDAQQIARFSVGLAVVRAATLSSRGDVSGDGAINIIDAQQIARYGVGLSAAARINTALFTPPTVGSLALSTVASQFLIPGNTVQLTAEPRDGTGASVAGCPRVTWSSSNPTMATVNGNGQLTVLAPGTVTITATSSGVSASSVLTIAALQLAGASLTTGNYHSCALTPNGKAYCWGNNDHSQLGNGTTLSRSEPGPVNTELTFLSLSAGDYHTCGLSVARIVYCWGGGWDGRLGDGATVNRGVPTRINSALTFRSIAAGRGFTCAISESGEAYCWGYNEWGQLGDGTTSSRSTPTQVQGSLSFTSIEGGYFHTCALSTSGSAYCWGLNSNGHLGDGTQINRLTPTLVSGGLQFAEISVGTYHTCGRTLSGTAVCWGAGNAGQLGTGQTSWSYVPTLVSGGQEWRQIRAGHEVTCGITTTSSLFCWGSNSYGAVGDGTRINRLSPVAVLSNVAVVSVGQEGHACAILQSGGAQCWGIDYFGSLGRGALQALTPTVVSGAPALTTLSANWHAQSFCGLTTAGTAQCWGRNGWDTFGAPTTLFINETPVPGVQGISLRSISGGGYHACGVTATNQGYCWGANWFGTHGSGNTNWTGNTPVQLATWAFNKIDAGENHTCAITTANAAYCWGLASNGRLGNGSTSGSVLSPNIVSGSLTFTDISSGDLHTCAIATGGAAYCWGYNGSGQLGNGTNTDSALPVAVTGGLTFSRIETGASVSCGLLTDGRVACWGYGVNGELGNGGNATRNTPTLISSTLTFTRLEVMYQRVCALTASGELYCWGRNSLGQVGTGNTVNVWSPVRIGTRTYTAVAGTSVTTCAIGTDTQTYCWGDNSYAQAGQRQTLTPQPVLGGLTFRTP